MNKLTRIEMIKSIAFFIALFLCLGVVGGIEQGIIWP